MRRDRRAMLLAGLCLALPLLVEAGKPDRSLLTDSLAASAAPLPADGLLVLLASLPDCHYCETVRGHYLLPLARAPQADRAIVELSLARETAMAGFDGRPVPVEQLARQLQLTVAPTVLFLDRCGQPRAEALVGGDVAGFYGAYFDRAVAKARASLAALPAAC